MVKIKRITTLKTYNQYADDLHTLLVPYLKKSGCEDIDILQVMKLQCHNPYHFSCIILEDEVPKGFLMASIVHTLSHNRIVIEHLYAPNMKLVLQVYKVICDKLSKDFDIPKSNIYFMTYRNPESWVRYCKKQGINTYLSSYVLRIKE